MKYNPREGDLPIAELVRRAEAKKREDFEAGVHTDIYFKFTCEHCGERCAFQEPNHIYESGECCHCGKETKVEVGGFTTVSHMYGPQQRLEQTNQRKDK